MNSLWNFPEVSPRLALSAQAKQEIEHKLLKAELEQVQEEFKRKIETANQLITELKQAAGMINNELIEIMRDIIHKVAYNLIKKELSVDKNLLNNCVETLINFIPYKNGLITVYLSPEDLERMQVSEDQSLIAQAKPELKTGDIVIKSNGAEIRALLSERIDLLIRDQHDQQ